MRDHPRNHSRGQVRAHSQSHPHTGSQSVWSQSLDKPPHRRVSFCEPENEDSVVEGRSPLAEPSVDNLGTWLVYQVRQLGTPTWWGELEAIPGIADLCRFAKKIRASFYVPEVWSRMFPEEGYSTPPAPQSLNREAYLPDKLTYQDIRQWPVLLTVAYCRCLQHWARKA